MYERGKIYIPNQIATLSFLGGPMAMTYALHRNFAAIGNREKAKTALMWGTFFTLGLVGVLPFLPDAFPPIIIPVAYTVAARAIAENYQFDRLATPEAGYGCRSNWSVAGVSLSGFLVFVILFVGWMFLLGNMGLITITD